MSPLFYIYHKRNLTFVIPIVFLNALKNSWKFTMVNADQHAAGKCATKMILGVKRTKSTF